MKRWLTLGTAAIFAATGLAISYIVEPPLGPDHSCPAGATPADCRYAPDHLGWSILWTVGGLLAGLIIGAIATSLVRRRRPDENLPYIY